MKKTTLILAALILASPVGVFAGQGHKDNHQHKGASTGHMLEGYEQVTNALYLDKLEDAKAAAAKMAEHDEDSKMHQPATALAKAKSLDEARESFKAMSAVAIKMAASQDKRSYTVMHCPMVKGGGGDWLQTADSGKKANNPYLGTRMPHCGGPKK